PPPPDSGAAALTLLGIPGEPGTPATVPAAPKSTPGQRAGKAPKVAPESENKVMIEATAPPKATVSNQDLPSVIVDEPEKHEERLLRNKQTLIIRSSSTPLTPAANWVPEPPPPSFQGPVVPPTTAMPIAESAYERRPSRARRRLMTV